MSDIFSQFNLLFNTDIASYKLLDEKNFFILNLWCGNLKTNVATFLDLEEAKLAGVPDSILMKELYLRIDKKNKFIKFPKEVKNIVEYDWLQKLFMQYYGWSKKEVDIYWGQILIFISEQALKNRMASMFGLENKERKLLGLEPLEKIKSVKKLPEGQRRLL